MKLDLESNPENFRGQKPGKPASERFERFPVTGGDVRSLKIESDGLTAD